MTAFTGAIEPAIPDAGAERYRRRSPTPTSAHWSLMAEAQGFTFEARKSGEVVIRHHGRLTAVLRRRTAARFLAEIEAGTDEQARMARLTGNYKRGNERPKRL